MEAKERAQEGALKKVRLNVRDIRQSVLFMTETRARSGMIG